MEPNPTSRIRRMVLRGVDWFITGSAEIGPSDLGLARNFVVNQIIGPFLLQAIALAIFLNDGRSGLGMAGIFACITACWFTPLLLKLTKNFHLSALISVELLCLMALIGISQYGGMRSPFIPWLLVSLMLGFFYLSDRVQLVLLLFAGNIIVTFALTWMVGFSRNPHVANLGGITWFSIFAAAAYMSRMALYYASIISMSSQLERSIDAHRRTASDLRALQARIAAENRGRTAFLDKISSQVRVPLAVVAEHSQALAASDTDPNDRSAIQTIERASNELHAMMIALLDRNDSVTPS